MAAAIAQGEVIIKLSVISDTAWHLGDVRYRDHVAGCDVMFFCSCHVIWLLLKDSADLEHNGLGLCDKGH